MSDDIGQVRALAGMAAHHRGDNPFGAPGGLRPEHQGDVFTVYAHPFGHLEIVRREDGASCYFQSHDDLITLRRDVAQAESRRNWEREVDRVCADYANVLTLPE